MKTLIKKLKALRIYAVMCSLSTSHWLVIWIALSCLFWWIYMGIFLLRCEKHTNIVIDKKTILLNKYEQPR